MPFRHLLFNRRNGAPQRAPDQQAISLDSQRFFSLENEFPQASYNNAGWSDTNDFQVHQQAAYHNAMMQDPEFAKQQSSAYNQPFDQSAMFPYNAMNGVPYQQSPYDFDSHSLHNSSAMDTDVSSISRGSIQSSRSSISHTDIMFDEDARSYQSLSRKPSVISSFSSDHQDEKLCPLITGQVAQCSPDLCGPAAPCLQYVNDDSAVPPIEECIRNPMSLAEPVAKMDNQPIDFTTPHNSPQRQRQDQTQHELTSGIDPVTTVQTPVPEDDKKTRSRAKRTATKGATETKVEAPVKQNKKSRARQAHSLVERKYRENLNAKIQELHQTLQKVQYANPCSHIINLHSNHDEDEDDMDETEKGGQKVKKSDVLIEAMNYVHATELELRRKDEEIQQLNDRIKMIENWMRNTSLTAAV